MSGAWRGRAREAAGILFGAACLVWIFHDLKFADVWNGMRGVKWAWIAPAIAADIASYVCQGTRWSILLRPLGSVTPRQATRAIYAGLFTNELLPMRVGEVVRSWLVSRWTDVSIARVATSTAVERLFDGFWLTIAFALAAIAVKLPRDLERGADAMGVVVLVGAAALVAIAMRPTQVRFLRDLHRIARAPGFFAAALVSAGVLVFQALAFWLVMIACGINLSVWAGAIVLLVVHLGTALPNAPGNVGSYQFFCIVGLALFGIDKTTATSFSLLVFVLLTVPLWALGFLALRGSGLGIARIRREAGSWIAAARGRAAG